MNLKNNQITVGEILSNPAARAYIAKRYPAVLGNPMLGAMRGMPLKNVIRMAGRYLPPDQINRMMKDLENL